jgi:hypothetical protein
MKSLPQTLVKAITSSRKVIAYEVRSALNSIEETADWAVRALIRGIR